LFIAKSFTFRYVPRGEAGAGNLRAVTRSRCYRNSGCVLRGDGYSSPPVIYETAPQHCTSTTGFNGTVTTNCN
jgi:hypothetical protein